MRTLELSRRPINSKELVQRSALETDAEILVSEPTVLTCEGRPVIIYGQLPVNQTAAIRHAVKHIDYQESTRTNGLKTRSRIFGYKPRNAIRADFCSATSLAGDSPLEHQVICEFGKTLDGLYQLWAPEVYARHRELVRDLLRPGWTLPGTLFTSGIVNQNNSLKYHFDNGNLKEVLSCMLVLRKDIEGGRLVVPEFNVKLDLQDSTYLLFDGQSLLHGVTQIKTLTRLSYRYSVVYYSLQGMSHCLTPQEEINRIRALRIDREKKRAGLTQEPQDE